MIEKGGLGRTPSTVPEMLMFIPQRTLFAGRNAALQNWLPFTMGKHILVRVLVRVCVRGCTQRKRWIARNRPKRSAQKMWIALLPPEDRFTASAL